MAPSVAHMTADNRFVMGALFEFNAIAFFLNEFDSFCSHFDYFANKSNGWGFSAKWNNEISKVNHTRLQNFVRCLLFNAIVNWSESMYTVNTFRASFLLSFNVGLFFGLRFFINFQFLIASCQLCIDIESRLIFFDDGIKIEYLFRFFFYFSFDLNKICTPLTLVACTELESWEWQNMKRSKAKRNMETQRSMMAKGLNRILTVKRIQPFNSLLFTSKSVSIIIVCLLCLAPLVSSLWIFRSENCFRTNFATFQHISVHVKEIVSVLSIFSLLLLFKNLKNPLKIAKYRYQWE